MIALTALVLVACGGGSDSGKEDAGDSADTYVLKYGHDHMPDSPFQESAERFKEIVEEESDGRIEVEIYPAEQIGVGREALEALQIGSVDMINMPIAFFAGFDIRYSLVDMPFLFPNDEALWATLDGEIGRELLDLLVDKDMKGVAFYAEGWRQMTNNSPIHSPDDFKNKKIRGMNAPVILSQYEAWGANPVALDYSEIYNALQQGVVEGQENPLLSISDKKFYEVQDYLMMSDHNYLTYALYANNTWLESLPEDLRDIVWNAGIDVAVEHRDLMDKANEGYYEEITASGIEVIELTDEERKEFREASQPVYDEFEDDFGDILERTIEFVKEFE